MVGLNPTIYFLKGMNIMRTMTDFIDSVSNSEHLAVYNEEYTWAEEYAEYYNEESDNYVQPILESSDYQFFGEACFIQEAHKGLIAGGILALISGAFFMIIKLLNGGGSSSGSSSSSSNNSNKRSDNNRRPSSNKSGNNNNRPPTNPSGGSSPQLHSLNDTTRLKTAEAELQKASECNNSAVVKLHDFCNDYLFNEKPKAEDIRDKLTDIYEGKTKESSAVTDSLPPNTPVGKFYDDIGKNMNKLEGVLEDRYLSRFKSSYEKGLKMFNDPDEDEEDVFSEIYQSLRKNVWERQNTLSNDNLKHLIDFLSSIGFKEVNISEGKKITPQDGKYFKEIFKQPTDDTSLNFTIKKIHEHPMEMNITLEGNNFNAILPGKASMYRIKG